MRNSIYLSKKPVESRADLLLEFKKDFMEVWCHVPCSEWRFLDLEAVCDRVSEKYGSPGLLGVLYYYDVLGNPYSVFSGARLASGLAVSHNVGDFTFSVPMWRRNFEYSKFMECVSELLREMESAYGSAWIIELRKRSDTIYVKIGFNDGAEETGFLDPSSVKDGNDMKFLCDCGQFKSRKLFRSECDFALDRAGRVGAGFYYNDSGAGCHDYVSVGNGRFFRNMGYVDSGYVSDRHSAYSYYVRARNIDEKKIRVLPRIGCSSEKIYEPARAFRSVEEFALERAAAGGLRIGDACYMYDVVVDSSGKKRSVNCTACWDGSKWVDYYKETEIKDWPASELAPERGLAGQAGA